MSLEKLRKEAMEGPSQQTYEMAVRRLYASLAELNIQKHRDYGTGNLVSTPFKPLTVVTVRLYEKIARLANLIETGNTPANESLLETLMDIIGYSASAYMIEDGTFELPMKGDPDGTNL